MPKFQYDIFFSMPKFQYDPTSNAANQEIRLVLHILLFRLTEASQHKNFSTKVVKLGKPVLERRRPRKETQFTSLPKV